MVYKIIYKIGLLIVIIIVFIICSFIILAYFQSQQTLLGNSINIAGKTRFLTMDILFQTSEYLNGILSSFSSHSAPVSLTSSTVRLNDAMNNLNANLLALRDGGKTSNVELEPLPSKYLDSWKIINNNWNRLTMFITYDILKPAQQQQRQQPQLKTLATASIPTSAFAAAAKLYQSTKIKLESLASKVINSSDRLVTQLGNDTAKDSRNLVMLEIFLAVLNIGVVILILYFVIKIFKPIDTLTRATSEIKKGNFDVPIQEHKGNDELSLLGQSFNSMVQSIKSYITTQDQLTSKLKELNERLKYKDQLKDQFVYTSAHELRNPIQPILGLSEFMRYRNTDEEEIELFDIIIRNAKRLGGLSEKILDIQNIESRTLMLDKERFNINEMVTNIINEIKLKENKIEIIFVEPKVDPVIVEADRLRIYEVMLNLLSNAIKFTKKSSTADASFNDQGSNAIIVFTTIKSNEDNINDKSIDEIVISIRDRGTGIDPKMHKELFSIFVTQSGPGSGLGLFISKGIVEAHGGKVWAENNADGKGATFSFTLPISQ
ncbi:MAG TPA: HAMP domain-containing sensor histidine kinase [Candidatus Bathyarchaeia archaeon]|nr:HAMP domain-containing sensor histidine kinase [Candidatus Bathyarchaeia archaeon]